jgi:SAM-dependent methyltransferase
LPQTIGIQICTSCDFGYTSPRDIVSYKAHYGAITNDIYGVDANLTAEAKKRYTQQMELLRSLLSQPQTTRVLDFGCGQAGLLRTILQEFPDKSYFAVDPNISPEQQADSQIFFSEDWVNIDGTFDLIILSHVIEHLVSFDDIANLLRRLSPQGQVYIEVPDAASYRQYQRMEYLYYFDRLHVNHFSYYSLHHLVEQWGLSVIDSGRNDFDYKDGHLYPAIYVLAAPHIKPHINEGIANEELIQELQGYIDDEMIRAQSTRERLKCSPQIVAYGFGDNFFRSISPGGPLSGLPIAAIVDRRYAELNQSLYAETYKFMDIATCCNEFSNSTFVVTVSWGKSEIETALHERGIRKIEFI